MTRGTKTALGIDISDSRISLALLKRAKDGLELLKTASAPVPDGTIKDGNIEDAEMLSKAIKELKIRNKMRESQAAVSLFVSPVLMQILSIPKQGTTNIRQFVKNEVKHYVALSGKEIALDFCRIGSAGRLPGRLFVVAADNQPVAHLAKACNQARLSVGAIEPPMLACTRAFHAKKIAGRFDCNVLMAILQDSALTLCVFRKESVDFVRTKNITEEKAQPDELCHWLAEQINTIIQFYDVEVPDNPGKWEVTVVDDDCRQLPEGAQESLMAKIAADHLQVVTRETAYLDTPVAQSPNIADEKPSPVAIGLAMKLLDTNGTNLRINLLPVEAAEVKAARKDALITANIIAAAILVMILAVGALALMTKKVNKNIIHKKQTLPLHSMHTLLRDSELIDRQIKQLSDAPDQLTGLLSSRRDMDWVRLLGDLSSGTPKTVRITNLFSKDNSKIRLEGLAMSYEAVRLFVDMLDKSDYIYSASLIDAEKDNEGDGLVRYVINCSLTLQRRKVADVN